MFIRLLHGIHWLYKPRKKKPGMKQKFNKEMRKWLKENGYTYYIVKDGPLSGIRFYDKNEATIFKMTWMSGDNSNTISNFIELDLS